MSRYFDEPVPLTKGPKTGKLEELALVALEDVMEGSDCWACESQVTAIDELREYLRMAPRCMRCSVDGHRTYDHYASRDGRIIEVDPSEGEGGDG